jgi:acyl carrier protein
MAAVRESPPTLNISIKVNALSTTFDRVADIIAETSEIDRDSITPESHTIDDLGIDSLDFLDIVFAVDKAFGIKIPLEQWTQEVNEGKVATEEYFVMKNLCAKIDALVAAKAA